MIPHPSKISKHCPSALFNIPNYQKPISCFLVDVGPILPTFHLFFRQILISYPRFLRFCWTDLHHVSAPVFSNISPKNMVSRMLRYVKTISFWIFPNLFESFRHEKGWKGRYLVNIWKVATMSAILGFSISAASSTFLCSKVYGTTKTVYGTTPVGCRGGNRYVEG